MPGTVPGLGTKSDQGLSDIRAIKPFTVPNFEISQSDYCPDNLRYQVTDLMSYHIMDSL